MKSLLVIPVLAVGLSGCNFAEGAARIREVIDMVCTVAVPLVPGPNATPEWIQWATSYNAAIGSLCNWETTPPVQTITVAP